MLYIIAITEILIYLFVAPFVRTLVDKEMAEYSFGIAIFFLVFFLFGGLLAGGLDKVKKYRKDIFLVPKITSFKWFFIIAWMLASIAISFGYELYNRRIGTASAAELFANIPPLYLVIFRSLEVSIPFLASLVILNFYSDNRIKFNVVAVAVVLVGTIFLLGAGGSRSWIGLIFLMVLILIQNKLPKRIFHALILKSALVSIFIFFGVTALRINSGDDRDWAEYVSAEVLQRVDGLEVVSQIIDKHGYHIFGINSFSLFNPIISAIPFLEATAQIKSEALTTVKSVILNEEFQSGLRDVNSFLLLDVYYWGGLIGVALAAIAIGFFSRLVDLRIGVTTGWIYQLFLVSVAVNLVILEREAVGIFMSVIRDWIVLCFISCVFLSRSINFNSASVKE